MATQETQSSWTGKAKLAAFILIAAALLLTLRVLPVDALVGALKTWIEGLGFWGPVIFAGIYAVWTVAFLPGSVLTLAGGAIFGLWTGAAAVIVGASIGAGLAFLIARYAAREKVERMTRESPKLKAVYDAIGEGGWKIVAMLRLSPALPFNVQNYFYGVTSIGFWPCFIATTIFITPGTFMFVYFGHVAGLAASGGGETTLAEWALRGVGLAATIAVTVYITKLANKKLAEQTSIEATTEEPKEEKSAAAPASPASAAVWLVVAVLMLAGAAYANVNSQKIQGLFGPPPVETAEAYERKADGPDVDHATFDALLQAFVDEEGYVDYDGLAERADELDAYLATLAEAPFEAMGRDQKLALLINAYNAFTLRLMLDHPDVDSIRDIPAEDRWDGVRWNLGGRTLSLNQIEHEEIRPKFAEPRIHFAVVCASVGCPPLRSEAFTAERLEEQLESQAEYVHQNDRWFYYEPGDEVVEFTQLYSWYGGDFEQSAGTVLDFAARYSADLRAALDGGVTPAIEWLDYDWSINEQ